MQIYLDEIKQRKYALEPTCGQFSAALPGVMSLPPPPPPPPQLGVIPVADYSMVLFETTTEIKSILSWSGLSVP